MCTVRAASALKLILGGAYTMPTNVVAGNSTGLRIAFGSLNAATTTATLSGTLSNARPDGFNVFAQNAGATLAISGNITTGSSANTTRVNESYIYTPAA